MGIGDRIRDNAGAFSDEMKKQFIARPDEAKGIALYKWPNANIRIGSQVTVQPDEFAYFVKQGEIAGYLRTGQHNVDGADIPFLGRWIDKATDGNFLMAEVYFVSTRDFSSNRFGGTMGQVTDPDTGLAVSMGIHGEFAFEITDAGKLIMNLVGTRQIESNNEMLGALGDQIVKHARSVLNGNLRSQSWDITKVTDGSLYVEMEPAIVEAVNNAVDKYGLRVTTLEDFSVAITDDSWDTFQEISRRRANMRLAGDPAWGAMTQGEVMLGAADGLRKGGGASDTAGALTGAGIGAGLGLGMGQQMIQGFGQTQSTTGSTIVCTKCESRNPETAKHCGECGHALVETCTQCGHHLTGKFCPECGTPRE